MILLDNFDIRTKRKNPEHDFAKKNSELISI